MTTTESNSSIAALAESISEPNWLYTLAADQRNLDLLPGFLWSDAERGCVHCKGAFVEIDQFGVEAPLTAVCVSDGGPLQVWSDEPMPVVAVKLLCSLGHTTVVKRAASWSTSLPGLLGVGLLGFYLFSKFRTSTKGA